jgi:hypothetical protein
MVRKVDSKELTPLHYIDRERGPAEAGLLPLGTPSGEDAEKSVKVAEKLLKNITRKSRK